MQTITSRQHPRIKELAQLKLAKHRNAQQQFLAEGIRTISTICTRMQPLAIFCNAALQEAALSIADRSIITIVTDEVMLKLSSSTTPPGIIGLFALPGQPTQPVGSGLVLANVSNPGNMGTMIRTAAAMGIQSVVVVEGTDPWGPKVVQASAGTIALLNIYQWDWQTLIARKGSHPLIALVVTGGAAPETLALRSGLIVVGNEAQGIPPAWLADCEQQCTIAMPGNTESLNAAIATSIVLYIAYVQQPT
jgi:TrmH family RNA methyltransferase